MKDIYESLFPKSVREILEMQEKLQRQLAPLEQFSKLYNPADQYLKSLGLSADVLEKIDAFNSISNQFNTCNIATSAVEQLRIQNGLINNFEAADKVTMHSSLTPMISNSIESAVSLRNIKDHIYDEYEQYGISAGITGYLEKFDALSRHSVLSEKIYPWSEIIKIQKSLDLPDYIKSSLHGIQLNRSIFHEFISDSEYERALEITSALNNDSVFFGEFENTEDFEEEEEQNDNQRIILPDEFKERLKTVQFIPVKLFEKISNDPNLMYGMDPIEFENFIAELMDKSGFENIIVTPRSGDKGRDIIATRTFCDIPIIFAFECKRYAKTRKIKPETMRALLGTVSHSQTKAAKGVLVTTSSFTRGAKSFIASESVLSGKDFNDLVKWINQVKK